MCLYLLNVTVHFHLCPDGRLKSHLPKFIHNIHSKIHQNVNNCKYSALESKQHK